MSSVAAFALHVGKNSNENQKFYLMFVGINFKSLFKMEKIRLLSVGAVGAVGTEIIQNAPALDPNEITSIGNLIIQIVIGVFTLFGMFKRKKK